MFEEDFIIRTVREGSIQTDQAIEDGITAMGIALFQNRALGTVVIDVEMANGQFTKEKVRWGQGNDPAFDQSLANIAQKLLGEAKRVVQGGGGGAGDLKLKVVAKK